MLISFLKYDSKTPVILPSRLSTILPPSAPMIEPSIVLSFRRFFARPGRDRPPHHRRYPPRAPVRPVAGQKRNIVDFLGLPRFVFYRQREACHVELQVSEADRARPPA